MPQKYSYYRKPIPANWPYIDVYRLVELYDIPRGPVEHAFKKMVALGKRGGSKDYRKDLEECIASLQEAIKMMDETKIQNKGIADGAVPVEVKKNEGTFQRPVYCPFGNMRQSSLPPCGVVGGPVPCKVFKECRAPDWPVSMCNPQGGGEPVRQSELYVYSSRMLMVPKTGVWLPIRDNLPLNSRINQEGTIFTLREDLRLEVAITDQPKPSFREVQNPMLFEEFARLFPLRHLIKWASE